MIPRLDVAVERRASGARCGGAALMGDKRLRGLNPLRAPRATPSASPWHFICYRKQRVHFMPVILSSLL
jgi:hypothetical protein